MKIWRHIFFCATLLMASQLTGQDHVLPLEHFLNGEIRRSVAHTDSLVPTGAQPYLSSDFNLNEVYGHQEDSITHYYVFTQKIQSEHLIIIDQKDFKVELDPLFDWHWGRDFSDTTAYRDTVNLRNNTRGFRVQGSIGKRLTFHTSFLENQSFVPLYQKHFVDSLGVMPGQGRVKDFEHVGYDYAAAYGWISFKATDFLNIQFGHNRNFVGFGYRSLLLSDVAFNYPQLKATVHSRNKKIYYSTAYAKMQNLERKPKGEVPESLFKEKAATFNYLGYMPHPRIELGLFESVIWERWNETGNLPLDYRSLIPVLGLNTLLIGYGEDQKLVTGAQLMIKAHQHLQVYAQLMYDRQTAYQAGLRFIDVLTPGLQAQLEYNQASGGAYQGNNPLQNYAHYNQPLAHPLGSGFEEWVASAQYRWGRWMWNIRYVQQVHDTGTQGAVFAPYEENKEGYLPQNTQTYWLQTEAMYLVNASYNFQAFVSWNYREQKWPAHMEHTSYLSAGIRTSIMNKYYDF